MTGIPVTHVIQQPYRLLFRVHALRQMFNRRINDSDVSEILRNGKIIEEYPDDTPYPSYLLSGKIEGRSLHVVIAHNKKESMVIVITAYEPDPNLWEDDYTRRLS
jgi:hypothetical protein